jgi:hypothetical protein
MTMLRILAAFVLLSVFSLSVGVVGQGASGCMRSVSQEFIATAHAGFFHKEKVTPPPAKPGALVEVRPAGNPPQKPMPLWKQIGRAGIITFAVQSIVGVLQMGASVIVPIFPL